MGGKKSAPRKLTTSRGAHAKECVPDYSTGRIIRPFRDWDMPDAEEYEAKRAERLEVAVAVGTVLVGLAIMYIGTFIYGAFRWGWTLWG